MNIFDKYKEIEKDNLLNQLEMENQKISKTLDVEESDVAKDLAGVEQEEDEFEEAKETNKQDMLMGDEALEDQNDEIKTGLIYEIKNIADKIPEDTREALRKHLMDNLENYIQSKAGWVENIRVGKKQFNVRVKDDARESGNQTLNSRESMSSDKSYMLNSAVVKACAALSAVFLGDNFINFSIKDGSDELKEKALKLKNYVNQYIDRAIPDYKDDKRSSFFDLALEGNTYQKIYFDTHEKKLVSYYISAEDIEINPITRDVNNGLYQKYYLNKLELDHKIQAGDFLDLEYRNAISEDEDAGEQYDDVDRSIEYDDDLYIFYQTRVRLRISDFGDLGKYKPPIEEDLPFIIDIDYEGAKIAAIYEDWESDDPNFKTERNYVKNSFFKTSATWDWGLIHLAAPLVKSATDNLRMISNAGMYSSFPTALIDKSIKNTNTTQMLVPGGLIPIETGGAFKLGESVVNIPFPQASPSLSELWHYYDQGVSDMSLTLGELPNVGANTPASSVLMMILENSKVPDFIVDGIFDSLRKEYRIFLINLKKYAHMIDKQYMSKEFRNLLDEFDFNDPNIIISPVGNNKISSQYIDNFKYENLLNLSDKYQGKFNTSGMLRAYITNLELDPDQILVPDQDLKPMTPFGETAALLAGQPVQAFRYQEQEAYILNLQIFMDSIQSSQELDPTVKQQLLVTSNGIMAQRKDFKYITALEDLIRKQMLDEGYNPEEIEQFSLADNVSELDPIYQNQIALMQAEEIASLQEKQQAEAANAPAPIDPNEVMMKGVEVEAKGIEQKAIADHEKAQVEMQKAMISSQTTLEKAKIDKEKDLEKANISARMKMNEIYSRMQIR